MAELEDATPRRPSDKRARPQGGAKRRTPREASRRVPAHRKPESSAGDDATTGKGPLILVVDDYQDAREMCAEYLRFSGFRVAEARNGLEAIEQALALSPDLVLMDLSLPGMDGWEATRRLKADERTCRILVVALTGHALAGHSERAHEAGCDAFITKPCLPDRLVQEIRKTLAAAAKKAKG